MSDPSTSERTTVTEDLHERSLPELMRALANETTTLVRQEIDLAKIELTERGKAAGVGAGMLGGAALFGLGSFLALTTAIVAALALALQVWLAALIVAVVYGIAAYVIAQNGKKELQHATPLAPQTTQTLKEDIEWAKTAAKSATK